MPSSTSSSEPEPVILRRIPELRWPRVAVVALVLALVGMGAWEAYWRVAQQYEASYRNSDGQWAEVRRRVDAHEPNTTVFIGSSRTLFDIDLDVWKEETGVHGIQLALEGSNPLPVLTDVANDDDFGGLLVMGITPPLLFLPGMGLRAGALEHYYDETPSQRISTRLSYPLETTFAYYNIDTKLFTVLARQAWWPDRPKLPFQQPEVRKIEAMRRDRQADLWERVETDPEFNAIVTGTWRAILENLPPPPPEDVARAHFKAMLEQVAGDVAKIRSRGGEVVFIRPPSSDVFREVERKVTPRERVWEPIIGAAGAVGVHFEDYPALSDVRTPEWSHISAEDKGRWTRALVGILREVMTKRDLQRPEIGS
jgi:hypothetical protein